MFPSMSTPPEFLRTLLVALICAISGSAAEPVPQPAPNNPFLRSYLPASLTRTLGVNEFAASTWMGKNGLGYRMVVSMDGARWDQVYRSLGARGGGGSVLSTNEMVELAGLLQRLPPDVTPPTEERRMTVAWRVGTNTLTRVYDRASPPREVVDLYLLCHSGFHFMVDALAVKHEVAPPGEVWSLAASPDADCLLLATKRLVLWNWRTGEEKARVADAGSNAFLSSRHPMQLSFDGTGKRIGCAFTFQLSVYDVVTGAEQWSYRQPDRKVGFSYSGGLRPGPSALSPDGRSFVVAGGKELRLYTEAGPGTLPIGTHDTQVRQVAWSPDGRLIASVGDHNQSEIRLWRPDGTPVATLPLKGRCNPSIAFSPDSLHLAVVEDRTWQVRIYDMLTRELEVVVPAWANEHMMMNSLSSVAWSPDGAFIAAVGRPGPLIICDVRKRQPVAVAQDRLASPVVFSRDSTLAIAICADGKIRFWDLAALRVAAK